MIDTSNESLIQLSKASRFINPARPPHISTMWRWARKGVAGVKLETIRIGGIHYTSHEAIARFLMNLNSDKPEAVPMPPNRNAEHAMKMLIAMGC